MSPRVAYWTSAFEPHMEAVSAEVATLRRRFPASVVWGLNPRYQLLLSWRRGYCLHPRYHLLFRAATRLLEPAFQLNHVFGSLGDWFFLEGRRRRPIVCTVATWDAPVERDLLQRVDRFAVEFPDGADLLAGLGIDRRRVRLILPPVDLRRFAPGPTPAGPFTALFASSPDREAWLGGRGVPQVLDAARLCPEIRFRLLWRPWGDSLARVREWIAQRELRNVEVVVGCWRDMSGQYRDAHVTLAPFTDRSQSKPAPNSVVEGLACGRPALVTEAVGLASLIREGGAGRVCAPTGEALAEGLRHLRAEWGPYSCRARALAERRFGEDTFVAAYEGLYRELLGRRAVGVPARLRPRGTVNAV